MLWMVPNKWKKEKNKMKQTLITDKTRTCGARRTAPEHKQDKGADSGETTPNQRDPAESGQVSTHDLTQSRHINSTVKKTRQHLYHLTHLETSKLPFPHLHHWEHPDAKHHSLDNRALHRDGTIRTELSDLELIFNTRCWISTRIMVTDLSHPSKGLVSLQQSGKCFCCLKGERTQRGWGAAYSHRPSGPWT